MDVLEDAETSIKREQVTFPYRKCAYAIAALVAGGIAPSAELLEEYRAAQRALKAYYGDE